MEALEGTLENIVFYSPQTSFLVGRLKQEGKKEETFTGYFPPLQKGETLSLKGEWIVHPRYGKQLQVKEWETIIPTTARGLERFLASGMIKGVGPHLAALLVKKFQMDTLEIIEYSPDRLLEISGIGAKKASFIHQSYMANKEVKDVILFLQAYNVSPSIAIRLFRHYGAGTIPLLKENPYHPADEVFGIGFHTADQIARKLGLAADSPYRVSAALLHLLGKAAEEGHVYLPEKELIAKVGSLLQDDGNGNVLTPPEDTAEQAGEDREQFYTALVSEQLAKLAGHQRIYYRRDDRDEQLIYAAPFYYAEKGVADKLLFLSQNPLYLYTPGDEILNGEILREEQLPLADEQILAVKNAFYNGVTVITGGPGTGKTTAIRTLIKLFQRFGQKILLAAPTGRAAKRMSEATGTEARTIHRLLEYNYTAPGEGPGFQRNEKNLLEAQVIIIDEVSMVDLLLFYNLLKAIPLGCRLVLVGDVDQLPSVGAGNVLRDIIASGTIPCVRLQTIFRQASESMIIVNAHRINQGEFPIYNRSQKDFFFLSENDPEKVAQLIVDLSHHRIPNFASLDPLDEIQVLTPMRRTPVGVERLNKLLQQELNPPSVKKQELNNGEIVFRLGDKVMQIRNNYRKEVFNGDMGRITYLDPREGEIIVAYPDFNQYREVPYDLTELDELVLSYAVSIHKSQGSEYPAVVMPLVTQHFIMLQRNLLYTGITRAKKLVIIVGSTKAMAIAIRNNKVEDRYSDLANRLKGN